MAEGVDLSAARNKIILQLKSWQLYYPIWEWCCAILRRMLEGADVGAITSDRGRACVPQSDTYKKKLVRSCLLSSMKLS